MSISNHATAFKNVETKTVHKLTTISGRHEFAKVI
jgi:hypothetical protein